MTSIAPADSSEEPTHPANDGTALQPLSIGEIAQRIQLIRGQRVLLDADLAAFYGETTKEVRPRG